MKELQHPKIIIVVSGKRKSGKDFFTNNLVKLISEEDCHILRVSSPIKRHFCEKYNLSYSEMITSSQYKEQCRTQMIKWGEEQRKKDSTVFCCAEKNLAVEAKRLVWILSDARRPSDVNYFRDYSKDTNARFYGVRVSADIQTRESRGWKFTKDVDDTDSECALDGYEEWDVEFDNSYGDKILEKIHEFVTEVKNFL